jgi:hypothetical protein
MCNPHDDRRLPAITRRRPAKSSASAGNFFESGTLLLRKRGRRPNDAPPPRSAPSPDGQRSPRAGTEPRCAASTPANTAPCLPRHAAGVSKTAAGARIAGRSIRFMDSSAAPMTGSRAARPRRRRARPTHVPAADSPFRGLSKRWGAGSPSRPGHHGNSPSVRSAARRAAATFGWPWPRCWLSANRAAPGPACREPRRGRVPAWSCPWRQPAAASPCRPPSSPLLRSFGRLSAPCALLSLDVGACAMNSANCRTRKSGRLVCHPGVVPVSPGIGASSGAAISVSGKPGHRCRS